MYGGRNATARRVGVLNANCIFVVLQFAAAAAIGRRRSDVVKLVVGKTPAAMAGKAVASLIEQDEAALGGLRDGVFVAIDPAVERRDAGLECPLKGRDGLGHRVEIDRGARQGRAEHRGIFGTVAERSSITSTFTAVSVSRIDIEPVAIEDFACASSEALRPSHPTGAFM